MASNDLSKAEQNFTCFAKACIDFIKLPLIDILTDHVKPVDLYSKIKCSSVLISGKSKLRTDQLKLCFFPPPLLPDYSKFDVTLLYTLIRNLCPSLTPTQGWGLEPNNTDKKIGDDIERLRLFRNNYAHADSTEILDASFSILWGDLQSIIRRIEIFTKTWSTTNYEQELSRIKSCRFGYDDRDKYKLLLEATLNVSKSEKLDEPTILIKGRDEIVCGDSARFDAEVKHTQLAEWSITWQKTTDDITRKINTSDKKYKESTRRQLVIQSVCKDDEAGYQAVLSNGSKLNIISNIIYLQALGEPPVFDVWNIVENKEAITIEYKYSVSQQSPRVSKEKWTKNGEALDQTRGKYLGGQIYCNHIKIMSPTLEDKGNYSCTVTNAVGSVSKDVTFDVPCAQISTDSNGCFGSTTIFKSSVSTINLKLKGIEWQSSSDGEEFVPIDISKPHYHGSKLIPLPLLVISKTKFEDRLYYRLHAWNVIGDRFSNELYLDVKGSPPNILTSHETCLENHSLKLIGKVFPYDHFNATKDIFWTKNGKKIETSNSEEKYSRVNGDDSSFTIYDVNEQDAGSYQLTATNEVGSTHSEDIVLDLATNDLNEMKGKIDRESQTFTTKNVPQVCLKRSENQNGSQVFTAVIKSIPAAYLAQWKVTGKDDDIFTPVDVNAEEYKGTSNSLPCPVLVVKKKEQLQTKRFHIEVDNFVGSRTTDISGDENLEIFSGTVCKTGTRKLTCDIASNIFNKNGRTIRFNDLRLKIIKGLEQSDLQELMDSLEVISDRKILGDVKSIGDFFRHILEEGVLTKSNVIILQYLLKAINRPDLEEMCVKYATTDKQALCYYEDPNSHDVPKVYLHVVDDIEHFTTIESLIQTVAGIVGCTADEIKVIGLQPENSFIIIITMKEKHLKVLKNSNALNLQKLLQYNVDWIEIEEVIRSLVPENRKEKVDVEKPLLFVEDKKSYSITTAFVNSNVYHIGWWPSMTRFANITLTNIGLERELLYSEISKTKKIVLLETSFPEVDNDEHICDINPITLPGEIYPFYIVCSSIDSPRAAKIHLYIKRRFNVRCMLSFRGDQARYSRFKDSYHFLTKCDTVLLLLTNDFLADPWCIFETKLAIRYKKNILVKPSRDVNVHRDLPLFLKHMFRIDTQTDYDCVTAICETVCNKGNPSSVLLHQAEISTFEIENVERRVGIDSFLPTKEYHLYIVHSREDKGQAMTICNDLWSRFKLKCVVSDRDCFHSDVWGIRDRMKNSIMVLLFLSPAFLKDYCCVFEMKLAIEFSCDRNSSLRLINVLLQDVDKIPPALKTYICLEAQKTSDNAAKINDAFYQTVSRILMETSIVP